MKRQIITIDEATCNGCGQCVSACAEGALQIVNGKARLVKEQFCDGFGDCLGECPTGALKIEMADADAFDFDATRTHVAKEGGAEAVRRLEHAAKVHEAKEHAAAHGGGGCPGTRMRMNMRKASATPTPTGASPAAGPAAQSELDQWPVQIHLVSPGAPFFKNKELLILSTCAPVASAEVHQRFIRGRSVAVGCPKLDNTDPYVEKLAAILSDSSIPKVIVVRMEVPCCGGLTAIAREALELSGRTDLQAEEVTVGLDGEIKGVRPFA